MKLEEGMYVRTKYGIITKVLDNRDNVIIKTDDYTTHLRSEVIKASHNIIDLIEVGDYVNGEKITRVIPQDICGDEVLDYQHIFVNDKEIFKHEINSIVTKEQFENISYEVE